MTLVRSVHYLLTALAAVLLVLLVRRAFNDVDVLNYDSLAYHLPFAARFWHITTPEEMLFLDHLEYVYQGFPLLAEILQGFFWRFFGLMQAANLVALCSLLVYCYFAHVYLLVPAYLMFISLLAVPMVQIHATSSLVDLPTNIACAIVFMVTYRVYAQTAVPTWRDIAVLALAAGVAVNMKFQPLPLVVLSLLAVFGRLVFLYRFNEQQLRRKTLLLVLLLVGAAPIMFATHIKNVLLYGNPVYPLGFTFLGRTLPHKLLFAGDGVAPVYLAEAPKPVRWLMSILEFRAYDARRPYLWMGEQGYLPAGVPADRMGGYFFVFVIINLLLLVALVTRSRSREVRVGAIFFVVLSTITSMMPQAHELRYYMYWIIVLITLNWYLLVRAEKRKPLRFFGPAHFGVVSCIVLLITMKLTGAVYFRPATQYVVDGYTAAIEPSIEAAIAKDPNICVLGSTNFYLLYADDFHPGLQYSIKAAYEASQCGTRVIVPVR